MALSGYLNMHGLQFGYDPTMDPQAYTREDALEMDGFWDPNLLDPSLRDNTNQTAFYQGLCEPEQPLPRFFFQPEKIFDAGHMSFLPEQSFQRNLNRPHEATRPIPGTYEPSRGSPSSVCSAATSPCTDNDWYPDSCQHQPTFEGYSLSRSASQSQGVPELEWSKNLTPSQMPMVNHINLSDVQGFADPQEVIYEDEASYMDIDSRNDFAMEADNRVLNEDKFRGHYRHSSDEGIGQSLKSEGSPEPRRVELAVDEDAEGDVDAEGEDVTEPDDTANDAEDPVAEEEDQDTDYKPKAPRAKRRRSSRTSPSTPSHKKSKITKPVPRKSQFQCKTCGHYTKDAPALVRHNAAAHTRPYLCTFSFAGCKSTFGNKNEWKRHVTSQHLGLQYWVCDQGQCSHTKSSANKSTGKQGQNDFNRKDLFTQHLKRMHAPFAVKRQNKKSAEWDERVKELQASCLKVRRGPPTKTRCPVRSCGLIFEGSSSWDDRMEHVGRHLEKTTVTSNGNGSNEVLEQESDEFMIQWALKEKIIERRTGNGFKLVNPSFGVEHDDDSDADGEDE